MKTGGMVICTLVLVFVFAALLPGDSRANGWAAVASGVQGTGGSMTPPTGWPQAGGGATTEQADTVYTVSMMGYRANQSAGGAISAAWTTGNMGNTWDEGEWVPYQTVFGNIPSGLAGLDSIVISFDFTYHPSSSPSRFIDLVRGIQVGTTQLDNTRGWPKPDGTPFPVTTRSEIETAQNHDLENVWIGFSMLNLPNDQVNRKYDGGLDVPPGEERHIFKIYKSDLIAAGIDPNAATVVIYFQLHESRTFIWMNQLQAGYDASPAAGWGGYLYGTDGWPEAAQVYGSGFVPGSSGHAQVEIGATVKVVPIPIPAWPAGTVSGSKWDDTNSNGVWDTGEVGLPSWEVHLCASLEQIDFAATAPTDQSGHYSFETLTYATPWIVKEDARLDAFPGSTYVQTYPEVGTVIGLASAIAVGPPPAGVAGVGWEVLLTLDVMVQDNLDFGNVQSASGITLAGFDTGLESPFPNPFADAALIGYSVPVASKVEIKVYSVEGKPVRTLVEGLAQRGHHNTMWNGRDDAGARLAPGIYVCRMAANGVCSSRKVILLD
jgi:hypothetical protein